METVNSTCPRLWYFCRKTSKTNMRKPINPFFCKWREASTPVHLTTFRGILFFVWKPLLRMISAEQNIVFSPRKSKKSSETLHFSMFVKCVFLFRPKLPYIQGQFSVLIICKKAKEAYWNTTWYVFFLSNVRIFDHFHYRKKLTDIY